MHNSISHLLTWTLIHSIWIAGALLLLSKIGTSLTKKSHQKSGIRLISLLIFIIVTAVVFVLKVDLDGERVQEFVMLLPDGQFFQTDALSWIERLEIWISSNSQLISFVWCLGLILSFARYYLGFNQMRRAKKFSHACAENEIIEAISKISQKLNLRSQVEVRVTSFVNSPLTTGWLKPIIYLPVGLTTGFSASEIDTILFHEMVHIKRQDYLVNLILASMETVFFFNPFILMIIKELRNDMEYACDDRVIRHNNKTTYMYALLKLQELRLSNSLGLAAKGNNSEFIKRINKMMNNTDNSNGRSTLIPGLIICLFFAVSIMGSAFVSKAEPVEKVKQLRTNEIQQDTIRAESKNDLKLKIKNLSKEQIASTVIMLDGKVVPIISGENLDKGETMMKHIKKELVRDGLLSAENKRVRLMFQYSDLLNGKEVLGDKYPKYKKIFNDYFPKYDSYATTRVFKFEN
ncbi:MAG: M56 family metallopeptidase [Ekhidna sp.]